MDKLYEKWSIKPTQLVKLKSTGEFIIVKEAILENKDMYSCFKKDELITVHLSEINVV